MRTMAKSKESEQVSGATGGSGKNPGKKGETAYSFGTVLQSASATAGKDAWGNIVPTVASAMFAPSVVIHQLKGSANHRRRVHMAHLSGPVAPLLVTC